MNMKRTIGCAVCALWALVAMAEVSLVPYPWRVAEKAGVFNLGKRTFIFADDSEGAKPAARLLRDYCREELGVRLRDPHALPDKGNRIAFYGDASLPFEGYTLRMYPDLIEARASSAEGFFYAVQTLKQLMTCRKVPLADIDDAPAMAWRGLHLDECRHFFGKEAVMRFIDRMAACKMNRLHWHLTDDQGWRIEVPGYPLLTQVGALRPSSPRRGDRSAQDGRPYGPFYYTLSDLREVVDYARTRHVTVVPEVEMPGHGYAAIAAYPWLCCRPDSLPYRHPRVTWGIEDDVFCIGSDSTLRFLERVLDTVCGVFDSPVVHIGGDEAPSVRWSRCPRCRARMEAEGLSEPRQLQYWLVNHMARYLAAKGRRLMGWSEIYNDSLPASAMLMSWQDLQLGARAAATGHDVVMTPTAYCYLDYNPLREADTLEYFDASLTLGQVYSLDPFRYVSDGEARGHIVGVQGNNWSEYTWTPAELERKVYPRALAIAEIGWTGAGRRTLSDFLERVARVSEP